MINKAQELKKANLSLPFVLIDLLVIILSLYSAFLLRFDGHITKIYFKYFSLYFLLFVIIKIVIYYFSGVYRFIWKYVSLNEITQLFKGNIYSFLVLSSITLLYKDIDCFYIFPRSVLLIDFLISFILLSGLRLANRLFVKFIVGSLLVKEKTLIIGAGDAGTQIVRNINEAGNLPYKVVGFIDDDKEKRGKTIQGIKILGSCSEIPGLVKRFSIETILIAMPSVPAVVIKDIIERVHRCGVNNIRIIPSLSELIDGKVGVEDIKKISVADLLGREELKIDTLCIEKQLKNKVILVTGAAGSIGSELCRKIAKFLPKNIIALDNNETGIFNLTEEIKNIFGSLNFIGVVGDIRDKTKINNIFNKFKPEIVFHAAAYKHVPMLETDPSEAVKTNIFGTLILSEAAFEYNTESFVFISTDKAANPISVLGATKKIAELIVQDFSQKNKGKFLSVRFGNVLESRGNVYEIFRKEIMEKRAVTVTDSKMTRYMMSISEAVFLLLEVTCLREGGLFIMDMGKQINIVDFAKEVIRLSGFEPGKDIPIVFTERRPGEKISEELLSKHENSFPTKYHKIFRVESMNQLKSNVLYDKLQNIRVLANNIASLKDFQASFKDILID